MRDPGEKAKLALVAAASVSTVGLFTFLATTDPERLRTRVPTDAAPPAAVELRRGPPAETPAPPAPIETGAARETPPPPPAAQGDDEPQARAEEAPAPPVVERAIVKDAAAAAPKPRRKGARTDIEAFAPPPPRRPVTRASAPRHINYDSLPSRKGPEPEGNDAPEPQEALPDFLQGF
jgi:hypothetical protein